MKASHPIPEMPADAPPPSDAGPVGVAAAPPPDLGGESDPTAQRATRISRVLEEIPYYPRETARWGINE